MYRTKNGLSKYWNNKPLFLKGDIYLILLRHLLRQKSFCEICLFCKKKEMNGNKIFPENKNLLDQIIIELHKCSQAFSDHHFMGKLGNEVSNWSRAFSSKTNVFVKRKVPRQT